MIRLRLLSFVVVAAFLACEQGTVPTRPSLPSAIGSFQVAPNITVRSITDLGTFGLDAAQALEINDVGEIAGATTSLALSIRPVFWSERTGAIDLGTLSGFPNGQTRAINNRGHVVGFSAFAFPSAQRIPTRWTVGPLGVTMMELGSFPNGEANDVNDAGTVVGWSSPAPQAPGFTPTAFSWTERGGFTSIPPLAGSRSQAFGINNRGDIVGGSTVAPSSPDNAVVWWAGGGHTVIGTLGGNTAANAINDLGEVAGSGLTCSGPPVTCPPTVPRRAYYWSATDGMIDLGSFGGLQTFAFEIDNAGRVTGLSEDPSGIRIAFVWTKATGMVALPTLGGVGSSQTGNINARGQLTGSSTAPSGARHAVIWQFGPPMP